MGDNAPGVSCQSGCRNLDLKAVNAFRASRNLPAVSVDHAACRGFVNLGLRLAKTFSLQGSHRQEFIAQLFNVLNRANFAVPQNNIGSVLFWRDADHGEHQGTAPPGGAGDSVSVLTRHLRGAGAGHAARAPVPA